MKILKIFVNDEAILINLLRITEFNSNLIQDFNNISLDFVQYDFCSETDLPRGMLELSESRRISG